MRHFSKMTEGELSDIIIAANKVQEMMGTAGYREIVGPRLDEAKKAADDAARWTPGKTTELGAIGLTAIYKDGRISGLSEIATIIKDLETDKVEAIRELNRRKEKACK